MSGKNNLYHVEFEQGYYNETIADTFEQYLEEEGKNSMCPECDVFVAMPDKKHNYFEEAEDIDGELKNHWLKTMKCFKNICIYIVLILCTIDGIIRANIEVIQIRRNIIILGDI